MATIVAADVSQAAVAAAVASASPGDTVQIPSGSANWSSAVGITIAPITITGAGEGSTIITNTTHASSGLETPCFSIQIDTDDRVEISDMTLLGTYDGSNHGSSGIDIIAGSVLAKQIVIHDITFGSTGALQASFAFAIKNGTNGNGVIGGVVYDCTFNNVRICFRNSGFVDSGALHGSSIPSPAWGTDNYFVFEDNLITFTAWTGGPQGANYMGDTEYPMNYIVRFCTHNVARDGAIGVDGYDMHGDAGTAENGFGAIIHDNVFNYTGSSVGVKLSDIRGGVGSLVFNNNINGQNGCYMVERSDPPGSTSPSQTYTWDNTEDAGAITDPGSVGPPVGYTEVAYPHPLTTNGGGGSIDSPPMEITGAPVY